MLADGLLHCCAGIDAQQPAALPEKRRELAVYQCINSLGTVPRAPVHGRQHTHDLEAGVVVVLDVLHLFEDLFEAVHSPLAAVHRDDDPVSTDQRVDRCDVDVRRAVHDAVVIGIRKRTQRPGDAVMARTDGLKRDPLVCKNHIHAAGDNVHVKLHRVDDHLIQRGLHREHVGHALFLRVKAPEELGGVGLLVQVHDHDPPGILFGEDAGQVAGRDRLADASLEVDNCDFAHLAHCDLLFLLICLFLFWLLRFGSPATGP